VHMRITLISLRATEVSGCALICGFRKSPEGGKCSRSQVSYLFLL
jgi:hypothetical protein